MKLYNTLTRSIEDFLPINDNIVKIYSCGPTVYDYAHIGNLRTYIFADTLRRVLEQLNYNVNQAVNITDVGHLVSDGDVGEDKLEKGAYREGKTVWEVADGFTKAFLNDVSALNILKPNAVENDSHGYAKATSYIDEQIDMVKLLVDKGFAYKTHQAIYFDVTKSKNYGRLNGQKLEDKETAARSEVVQDKDKRHPYDFAVWFFRVDKFVDHAMHWPSPWGNGFPGWHIECSAIIHKLLADPIDIHTGGIDLIGTHHTNEIAQTQAAYGNELAKYWLHSEFILVDGTKMSKSLNNFYRLKDIENKGIQPLAYRVLVLQAHYRSQLNFTWESLVAAESNLRSVEAWADLIFQDLTSNKLEPILKSETQHLMNALGNDLNTPLAMASLNNMINETYKVGADSTAIKKVLKVVDKVFGLKLTDRKDITNEQKQLIVERQTARGNKDWGKADDIRDLLIKQGIQVNDSDNGQIWSRL